MGMAASQARFLNLTARRTNIEYEGQQINQQRTELSNESANLYNQMLGLRVPTPPNTQDYTKIEYTFMMPGGNDEAHISQIAPEYKDGAKTGKYVVVFSYTSVEFGVPPCSDNEKSKATKDTEGNYLVTSRSGKTYKPTKYDSTDAEMIKIHGDAVAKLTEDASFGDVYFINTGTEEKPIYHYYSGAELATATADDAKTNAVTWYQAADVNVYHEDKYSGCSISRDTQNRVQSFTVTPVTEVDDGAGGTTEVAGTPTTFAVTTKTITDEAAYNDAMNEYTYQSYLYEQEMNNINARTSIVHAQDRDLELRLKQLDTEHNAVQTEMETVKSVCKKNVEDSFKTFA